MGLSVGAGSFRDEELGSVGAQVEAFRGLGQALCLDLGRRLRIELGFRDRSITPVSGNEIESQLVMGRWEEISTSTRRGYVSYRLNS